MVSKTDMTLIHNICELCYYVAGWEETDPDEAVRKVTHRIYRDSESGVGMLADESGVQITSIAEGFDAEFSSDKLIYPFTLRDFYKAILDVDVEVDMYLAEVDEEEGE